MWYTNVITESSPLSGKVVFGGKVMEREGYFVEPTIITGLPHDCPVVHKETFAPIVYILKCSSVDEGISWNNEVKQGLSSSLFTQNLANVFKVSASLLWYLKIIHSHVSNNFFLLLSLAVKYFLYIL